MKRYLLTTVSSLALASVASAADMPVKALPPPAVVQLWAGPYIGINGGVVWHQLKTDTIIAANGFPYDRARLRATGGTFGGQVGYNWQSQNFVYGLEADANWVSAKGTDQHAANNGLAFPVVHTTKLSWLATVRGRAGVTLGTHTLVYGTGGLAVGGVENNWRFAAGACCVVSYDKARAGWTAGGGIERFISNPHLTVKAEALYVDLGRASASSATGNYRSNFRNTAIVGRLGLNLKW